MSDEQKIFGPDDEVDGATIIVATRQEEEAKIEEAAAAIAPQSTVARKRNINSLNAKLTVNGLGEIHCNLISTRRNIVIFFNGCTLLNCLSYPSGALNDVESPRPPPKKVSRLAIKRPKEQLDALRAELRNLPCLTKKDGDVSLVLTFLTFLLLQKFCIVVLHK